MRRLVWSIKNKSGLNDVTKISGGMVPPCGAWNPSKSEKKTTSDFSCDANTEENHSNEHASYEIPPLTNIFESPIILSLDSLFKKSPKTNCD